MAISVDSTAKILTFTDTVDFKDLTVLPELVTTVSRGLTKVDLVDYRIIVEAGATYTQCQDGAAEQLILREPAGSEANKLYIAGTVTIGSPQPNTYDYAWNNGHVAILEENGQTETQAVWQNSGRGSSGRYATLYVHSGGSLNIYGNSIQLTGAVGAHPSGSITFYDATLTAHYIYMYCPYNAYGKSRINVLGAMKLLGQLGDVSGLEIYDPVNKVYLSSSGTTPSAIQTVRDLPRLPEGYKPWQGGSNYSTGIDFINPAQDCNDFLFDSGTYTLRFTSEFKVEVSTADGGTPDVVSLYAGNGDWSELRYQNVSDVVAYRLREYRNGSTDTFYGYNNESKLRIATTGYGYTVADQVYDASSQYVKTYPAILLPDTSVTERDASVVSAYTDLDTAKKAHDRATLFWVDNFLTYKDFRPTSISGNVLICDYDLVIDATAAEVFTFDGSTVTIKSTDFKDSIECSKSVTVLNGAKISGNLIDQNGVQVKLKTNLSEFGFYGEVNGVPLGSYEYGLTEKPVTLKDSEVLRCVVGAHGYQSKYLELSLADLDAFSVTLDREGNVDTSIDTSVKEAIESNLATELEGQLIAIVVKDDLRQYSPEEFISGFDYFVYRNSDVLAPASVAAGTTNLYTLTRDGIVNYSPNFYARLDNAISSSRDGGYMVPITLTDGAPGVSTLKVNTNGIALSAALWGKQSASFTNADQQALSGTIWDYPTRGLTEVDNIQTDLTGIATTDQLTSAKDEILSATPTVDLTGIATSAEVTAAKDEILSATPTVDLTGIATTQDVTTAKDEILEATPSIDLTPILDALNVQHTSPSTQTVGEPVSSDFNATKVSDTDSSLLETTVTDSASNQSTIFGITLEDLSLSSAIASYSTKGGVMYISHVDGALIKGGAFVYDANSKSVMYEKAEPIGYPPMSEDVPLYLLVGSTGGADYMYIGEGRYDGTLNITSYDPSLFTDTQYFLTRSEVDANTRPVYVTPKTPYLETLIAQSDLTAKSSELDVIKTLVENIPALVESELIDDATGQAFLQAVKDKIANENLTLSAIAEAVGNDSGLLTYDTFLTMYNFLPTKSYDLNTQSKIDSLRAYVEEFKTSTDTTLADLNTSVSTSTQGIEEALGVGAEEVIVPTFTTVDVTSETKFSLSGEVLTRGSEYADFFDVSFMDIETAAIAGTPLPDDLLGIFYSYDDGHTLTKIGELQLAGTDSYNIVYYNKNTTSPDIKNVKVWVKVGDNKYAWIFDADINRLTGEPFRTEGLSGDAQWWRFSVVDEAGAKGGGINPYTLTSDDYVSVLLDKVDAVKVDTGKIK